MSVYVKLDDIETMPIRLNHYDEMNGDRNFVLGIEMAMKFIDGLPRHEFPDVIECKNCKLNGSFQQCPYSIMTGTIPSDNWFCADAKKGRWIRHGNPKDGIVEYECSECGKIVKWTRGMPSIYPADECPNCKADMVSRRKAVCD